MKNKFLKYFSATAFLFLIFSAAPAGLRAQESSADSGFGYVLLEPLPRADGASLEKNVTLTEYMAWVYKFILFFAAFLAVMQITIGGAMFIASGANEKTRSSARDKIWGAIYGLILVFAAYLVLYTINPQLVSTTPDSLFKPVQFNGNIYDENGEEGNAGGSSEDGVPYAIENKGGETTTYEKKDDGNTYMVTRTTNTIVYSDGSESVSITDIYTDKNKTEHVITTTTNNDGSVDTWVRENYSNGGYAEWRNGEKICCDTFGDWNGG